MKKIPFTLVSLCLLLAMADGARTQSAEYGRISGRVTDTSGAVLPGAAARLVSKDRGFERTGSTDASGNFAFHFVPPGTYVLIFELQGFARAMLDDVRLLSAQTVDIPVMMLVGAPNTVISVSAHASEIDIVSPALRSVLPKAAIRELPVMTDAQSRSTLGQLSMLFAGASSFQFTGLGDPNGSSLSINGSPLGGIGFYVDGVDNSYSGWLGSATMGPNPDAIDELTLLSQNFKAESGGHQAQVHMRIRSGTNQVHGLVRALQLNPDLSARDFFDGEKPTQFTTSAVGFSLGGPVVVPRLYDGRNRTFWFYDTEWTRSSLQQPISKVFPGDAERGGDFSSLPPELWPADPLTGQPFPDGRLPKNRVLPQSRFYVDQFIPRDPSGGPVVSIGEYRNSGYQFTTRLDHSLRDSGTLSGSLFSYRKFASDTDPSTIGTAGKYPERGHNISVQYARRISARMANVFVFGSASWAFDSKVEGKFTSVDLTQQGYEIHDITSGPRGFPNVSLDTNTNTFSPAGYQYTTGISNFHWRDDLSLLRGPHSWKFGIDMRSVRENYLDSAGSPAFGFSGLNSSGTGIDFADLLLGIPESYSQGSDVYGRSGRLLTAVYAQDDIQLHSRITLNLGLRYELNGIPYDRDGRVGTFRPGSQSKMFPEAPAGILFNGDTDPLTGRTMGRSIASSTKTNFAPRIGIAWSPGFPTGLAGRVFGGPGRTSIRAGYGIYYILARSSPSSLVDLVPPWHFSVLRDRSQLDASGGTLTDPWGSESCPFMVPLQQRRFYSPLQDVPYAEPGLRDPRQQQWTLSLQRQLPAELVLELAYVGNRSRYLMRTFEANPARVTAHANPNNVESRRTFEDFGHVSGFASDGESIYHALQSTVSRRFASRLLLNFHYVWSRALDDASGIGVRQFGDRAATPWGRANTDRTHSFAGYWVLDLPGFQKYAVAEHVLSGWRLSGDVQIRSGAPLQIRNPFDSTLQGFAPNMPDIIGPFRIFDPRDVRNFTQPTGRTATGNFLFDPSVFRTVNPKSPSQARIGNLGRNVFSGPGAANVDLSLAKEFRLTERHRILFRMDATNALNHAQFVMAPKTNTQQAMFGQVARTTGPRRIQFQLRYNF